MLEIAEGICTVQGLQTLVSSDPVANLPRRCCPAGLLLGQTAQRAVGRRAARSALGGGAGSGLAPQASSSACRQPAWEHGTGPVRLPPSLSQAVSRRFLLLLHAAGRCWASCCCWALCLAHPSPPHALTQGLVAPVRLPSASTASHLPPAALSF